jgi:hypothetical protein
VPKAGREPGVRQFQGVLELQRVRWTIGVAVAAVVSVCVLAPSSAAAADPPTCAPGTSLSLAFGGAPATGSVSGTTRDCYKLPDAKVGDRLQVRSWIGDYDYASWSVKTGGGEPVCGSNSYSNGADCTLTFGSDFRIEIGQYYNYPSTVPYRLVVRRLTDPAGCQDLTDPGAFGTQPLTGELGHRLDARCFTFDRAEGSPDQSYAFRAVRTAGNVNATWSLYGPNGTQRCYMEGYHEQLNLCELRGDGQFTFVVSATTPGVHDDTGTFGAVIRRTANPAGCTPDSGLGMRDPPNQGTLDSRLDMDCLAIDDVRVGDRLAINGNSSETLYWALLDPTGKQVCSNGGYYSDACVAKVTGPHSVVVYRGLNSGSDGSSNYTLRARRLNEPTGCEDLGTSADLDYAIDGLEGSFDGPQQLRCYTFDRPQGSTDEALILRATRTSGDLSTTARLYSPSGEVVCTGYIHEYGDLPRCQMKANGRYMVVVETGIAAHTGAFELNMMRGSHPGQCEPLTGVGFDDAPTHGTAETGPELRCFEVPDAEAPGDTVDVSLTSQGGHRPAAAIFSSTGTQDCGVGTGETSTCKFPQAGKRTLVVYDRTSAQLPYSFDIAVRRINNPEGCQELAPDAFSFAVGGTTASINEPLQKRCFTFERSVGEGDGSYRFGARRLSGSLAPLYGLYGPTGVKICGRNYSTHWDECYLHGAGRFTVVVGDDIDNTGTGTFRLHTLRVSNPEGCTEGVVENDGIAPTGGNLADAIDVDCYRYRVGAGDRLGFSLTPNFGLTVLGDDGNELCRYDTNNCRFAAAAVITVLVRPYYAEAGAYTLSASCLEIPCGAGGPTVVSADPFEFGSGQRVTTTLKGRGLDLLESIELVAEDGATVATSLGPAGSSARARTAELDLRTAATGVYGIRATFPGDITVELPDAITVVPPERPDVSVDLLGHDVFRIGGGSEVEVVVTNTSNVAAYAVPVMLDGIPAGSQVRAEFQMQGVSGTLANIRLANASLDYSTDIVATGHGLAVPVVVPRIPAESEVGLRFVITPPTEAVNVELRASVSGCLVNPVDPLLAPPVLGDVLDFDPVLSCLESLLRGVNALLPDTGCEPLDSLELATLARAIVNPLLNLQVPGVIGWNDLWKFALDAAGCEVSTDQAEAIAGRMLEELQLTDEVTDAAQGEIEEAMKIAEECINAILDLLPQTGLIAIDPNEVRGPQGVGEERYLAGRERVDYQVLFENMPESTARAHRVHIVDQLDTDIFRPGTVRFGELVFGPTTRDYGGVDGITDRIDLRPAQDLLVDVEATVSPAGRIEVVLQAIDPATDEPPTDPRVGFLPPNLTSPEGEGHIEFEVQLNDQLPTGTTISNGAVITFDSGPAIEAPAWTNILDSTSPNGHVTATKSGARAIDVEWDGQDAHAGMAGWEISYSLNGGAFQPWRDADESGRSTFTAPADGTYVFNAVVTDRVGNEVLITSNPVTLSTPVTEPPPTPNAACERAQSELKNAQAKLAKVRQLLKKAKRSGKKQKVKRAMKKLGAAKDAFANAERAVGPACR